MTSLKVSRPQVIEGHGLNSGIFIPSKWDFEPTVTITTSYIGQTASPIAWHQLDALYQMSLNNNARYWWETCGHALATFLLHARYSYTAQTRILDFFARVIAPRMGIAHTPNGTFWPSFMTDNHGPMEMSWEWLPGHQLPSVRFSIEPISEHAGTAGDLFNELIGDEFMTAALKEFPQTDMRWFNHFKSVFSRGLKEASATGHGTSFFSAFDLDEETTTSKAYFFPEYKAIATQKSTIQVVTEAIKSAPGCTSTDIKAINIFQDFATQDPKRQCEIDIFAIDLVDPSYSRIKVYFRIRDTTFHSVCQAMTLGGKVPRTNDVEIGLHNLRRLWDSLFDQWGVSEHTSLPASSHRTAGILYNVDIRTKNGIPKVKIYMPARHYGKTDWQVMHAIADFVQRQEDTSTTTKLEDTTTIWDDHTHVPASAYNDAMRQVFGDETLRSKKGRQTYVGCSIEKGGKLRVVAYVNPKF